MSITTKSDITDKHRCPHCGRYALAAACGGELEDWEVLPNGQWLHKSCSGVAKRIKEGIAMYGRLKRGPARNVWEVE